MCWGTRIFPIFNLILGYFSNILGLVDKEYRYGLPRGRMTEWYKYGLTRGNVTSRIAKGSDLSN